MTKRVALTVNRLCLHDLHPRNPHRGRYDFKVLCAAIPELARYLKPNPKGDQTVDFSDPAAVLCLNRALLAAYYDIRHWSIPEGYLCPPIPGRADYIHHLADLLQESGLVCGAKTRVLDIGTGANCIYPIIGHQAYGWRFVASEIDPVSAKSARRIVQANPTLQKAVRVVQQKSKDSIFRGIIKSSDQLALTLCNPPFHRSEEAANEGSQRKQRNLGKGRKQAPAKLNFGGQANELWCDGGELRFIQLMIEESVDFQAQVQWFTSLVSKSAHLPELKKSLSHFGVQQIRVIEMQQGQKLSRILAWSFSA